MSNLLEYIMNNAAIEHEAVSPISRLNKTNITNF